MADFSNLCNGGGGGIGRASGTNAQGDKAAGAAKHIKLLWAFLEKGTGGNLLMAVFTISGIIGAFAFVAHQGLEKYFASETDAINQVLERLEAEFATSFSRRPGGTSLWVRAGRGRRRR